MSGTRHQRCVINRGSLCQVDFSTFGFGIYLTQSVEMYSQERHPDSTDVLKFCHYSFVIAFVKEHFHNAVEINILGIFEGYSSLQILPPPKKNFSGAKLFRNYSEVLTCVLVCFLVEFDLLVAFGVLSCRILDCASLFIYVHEHDCLCFPMLTEERASAVKLRRQTHSHNL